MVNTLIWIRSRRKPRKLAVNTAFQFNGRYFAAGKGLCADTTYKSSELASFPLCGNWILSSDDSYPGKTIENVFRRTTFDA